MEVETKTAAKVKRANRPFGQAFSQRRMAQEDCNVRRPPTTPTNKAKTPWYESELPTTWTAEETQLIRNWMCELSHLDDLLFSVAGDRLKFLRKIKKVYLKLSYQAHRRICDIASRSSKTKPSQNGTAPLPTRRKRRLA